MTTGPPAGVTPGGPRGLPWIGVTRSYFNDPAGFIADCSHNYGDVVQYTILGNTLYQLNTPEAIEHVLVSNNQNYIKGELFQELLGPVTGSGVLNREERSSSGRRAKSGDSEGEQWRKQRHRLDPTFHPDRIAEYAETMVRRTNERVTEWRDGETRDVHTDAMRITLEIVADALFGVDIEADVERVGTALDVVMEYQEGFLESMFPVDLPTPSRRRYEAAIEELDQVVYRIIDERQRNPVMTWCRGCSTRTRRANHCLARRSETR